jgi:uncharacterized protein YbjT (DUF2867 family)
MLLVVGGTGELGGRVVRLLRDQGNEVRCLVRVGSDAGELRRIGAQVVSGDLTNAESLAAACQGITTVVATATVIARRLAGARKPSIKDADEIGMASLVDAAEAAGVRRFVYISFPGVATAVGTPLERAKLAIEKRLERSTMQRVVVRADAFQEIHLAPIGRFDLAKGKVAIIGKGDTKQRWISQDDVAALLAAVAVEPDPPALIVVGGPEAISKNEAVAIAESFLHRRLKVQRMPRPLARLAVRLLSGPNDALASVFGAGLLQDLNAADWDDEPLRQRGIKPRAASTYLQEQARLLTEDAG